MPYLTPIDDTLEIACLSVYAPNDLLWRIAVSGAIQELFMQHNWEEYGLSTEYVTSRLIELNPNLNWGNCSAAMSCDDIADCIDTSPNVQNTLNEFLINSGSVNPDSIDPNTTGQERLPDSDTQSIYPDSPSCDYDVIWAGIREMVERIDQEGRDLLEDLAVINDKIQQWSEIIDLVPILGDIIKDIGDLFTEQLPDILNAYNSASSPTFLDGVACDIFNIVCGDCRYPTWDEVMQYFGQNSYVSLPSFNTVSYAVLWDLIKSVTIVTSTPVWYTINAWQIFTMAFGGRWNGSHGLKTLKIWCSFGEEFANDNWEILCDPCLPPFELYFDFSTGTQLPPLTSTVGQYDNTRLAWRTSALSNTQTLQLNLTFPNGQADYVRFDYSYDSEDGMVGSRLTAFNGSVEYTPLPFPTTNGIVELTTPTPTNGNFAITVRGTTNRLSYPGAYGWLHNLTIRGRGFVPASYVPYMVYGTPA